jgi:uncharacterized protein YceK
VLTPADFELKEMSMSFRSYLIAAALAGILMPLTGCGTLIGRSNSQGDLYPGLQQDAAFLGLTGAGEPYNPEYVATIFCYLAVVCVPGTLLSVPLDAAIDTVLLPIDLINIAVPPAGNR